MAFSNQAVLKIKPSTRLFSPQILDRFCNPLDRMTAQACQCLWKIYGNPEQNLTLAELYRCYRQRMGAILASGNHKALELDNSNHPFFCHTIDNDFQYPIEAMS